MAAIVEPRSAWPVSSSLAVRGQPQADPLEELHAVHARHAHVREHGVDRFGGELRQGLFGMTGRQDAPARGAEQAPQRGQDVRFVDAEHGHRHGI